MNDAPKRLLLLCSTTGYQTRAFVEAAGKIGLSVAFGTDRCHVLEDPWQDGALALRFEDPAKSAEQILEYSRSNRIDAIVAIGDRPTSTAARACQALGLPHHPPQAVNYCRDKYSSRKRLRAAGLNVPRFSRFPLASNLREIAVSAQFPCVLKPLALSASRGVIRADTCEQFTSAFERLRALLRSPEVLVMREAASNFILVEAYIDGQEIAVEGLVDRSELRVLAIFDKPDPLVGPFFEETLYVTPSRLDEGAQNAIAATVERAVQALGLFHGPIHAELRINPEGVWILEVAARSIGGLCSRALRFSPPSPGEDISLEELIVRLALGMDIRTIRRVASASGVMMIPIPAAGIFEEAQGLEEARRTTGIEEVVITAKPAQRLVSLPEGSSYLGFIFARGRSPEFVEAALRSAHQKLRFVMSLALPVI